MADKMPQQNTSETTISKTKEEIIKEAHRIEESVQFSAKGHFAAAEGWSNFHFWIGIPTAVGSAVAGGFALSENHLLIGGILSILASALSAVLTFVNPNERSAAHLSAGNNYDALVNRTRIFRTIECWRENSERLLTEKLMDLSEEKSKLNHQCPQIPGWAYRCAKKGIKSGETRYQIDAK